MLHLGKKEFKEDSRDILYEAIRPKVNIPKIPPRWGLGFDFQNGVPQPLGWGMFGNGPDDDGSISPSDAAAQGCGDCVWAGAGHEEMLAAHQAIRPIPPFNSFNIVTQYGEYSGYNLKTGANDNGSNVREVYQWRQNKGLLDKDGNAYKIGTFVQIPIGNWQHLQEACYCFEAVGLGFRFPGSAMNQFNNGQPWTVQKGSPIEGGHYVPIVGHPAAGWWTCITWGQRQMMTADFITTYADELWAYLDIERYEAVTGKTYNGFSSADLEAYLSQVQ